MENHRLLYPDAYRPTPYPTAKAYPMPLVSQMTPEAKETERRAKSDDVSSLASFVSETSRRRPYFQTLNVLQENIVQTEALDESEIAEKIIKKRRREFDEAAHKKASASCLNVRDRQYKDLVGVDFHESLLLRQVERTKQQKRQKSSKKRQKQTNL